MKSLLQMYSFWKILCFFPKLKLWKCNLEGLTFTFVSLVAVLSTVARFTQTFVPVSANVRLTLSPLALVVATRVPHGVHRRKFVRIELTPGRYLVTGLGCLEEVDKLAVNINLFEAS